MKKRPENLPTAKTFKNVAEYFEDMLSIMLDARLDYEAPDEDFMASIELFHEIEITLKTLRRFEEGVRQLYREKQ